MSLLTERISRSIKNWWVHILLGIIFILMGIWVMRTPLASYIGLSIFFSVIMFISGLAELIFALSNRKEIDGWGWFLAAAIIDFLIGILLISNPQITMVILPFYLAFWLMFKGLSAIGASIEMKRYSDSQWGWMLITGIGVLITSFLLLANPVAGGISIVLMTSLSLLFIGVFRIILGVRLRKLGKRISTHL